MLETHISMIRKGKPLSLELSFLTENQKSLFLMYLNKKMQRRVIKESIRKKRTELNALMREGENPDQKRIEKVKEEIKQIERDFSENRFLHFEGSERQSIYQIKKKMQNLKKYYEEIKEIDSILEYIKE